MVDSVQANNREKIEEFSKAAAKFNALKYRGYVAAKPYFNVLRMINGRVYFVFGFKDQVQGIHRKNYPGTVKNLRRLKNYGVQKYPGMHWVPIEEIRRLIIAPLK